MTVGDAPESAEFSGETDGEGAKTGGDSGGDCDGGWTSGTREIGMVVVSGWECVYGSGFDVDGEDENGYVFSSKRTWRET